MSRRVDFSRFDPTRAYGPQQAEALAQADGGISDVRGAALIEEHATAQRSAIAVTFPRADDSAGDFYYAFYAADCRGLMRRWIAQEFAKVPNGVERTAEQWYAETCATAEMNRVPNAHEKRLIGECVRDLSVAREAIDRERELQREVL